MQPVASRRRARIAQSATLDAPVELGSDPLETPIERLRDWIVQQRAGAGQARQLGDPGAHRAGAGDSDRLRGVDCDAHAGTSAFTPVNARPMISF